MHTTRLAAEDVMNRRVTTVAPDMTLPELEQKFLDERVSGFPVVDDGELVGIVSRSDVVRQLCVERSLSGMISDYYHESALHDPVEPLEELAARVGVRIEMLRVRDVMTEHLYSVEPENSVGEVADLLVRHRIHRIPVIEEGRLVGLITSLDLVRLLCSD